MTRITQCLQQIDQIPHVAGDGRAVVLSVEL